MNSYMSSAEITARKLYREYNLGDLTDDVKKQLIILFLTNQTEVEVDDDSSLPIIPVELLRTRAEQSYQEAIRGEGRPVDELFEEIGSKYQLI